MANQRGEKVYSKAEETLNKKKELLLRYLETQELPEEDKVRLGRVLSLIQRYAPKRNLTPQESFWKSYLTSAFRFLPALKKKEKEPEPLPKTNLTEHSLLLADEVIRLLRNLRSADRQLKKEDLDESAILDQKITGEVVEEKMIETSVTLDYERKNWGVERICLDGVQNHLPQDAKGTQTWVQCLVNGQWISVEEAAEVKDKIKQIRFVDDGVGFDEQNLSLFYSTKADEKESAGQFGEGMKMIAAASLREGLEPLFESQNWQATPEAKKVIIEDTRNKTQKKTEQLTYDFQRFDGPSIIGSRTTFRKVTPEFVEEVLKLPGKVLSMRENYRPKFIYGNGEIVDTSGGQLFVKGILVEKADTIFSYNLALEAINRDRNTINRDRKFEIIVGLLGNLNSVHLIKTFIQKGVINPRAYEIAMINNLEVVFPTLWKQAFLEIYGPDAVVDTGYEPPEKITLPPQNKIKLPRLLNYILLNSGVSSEKEALPPYFEERVDTGLTIDTGADIWHEERILLDAIQNHLPHDSGGSSVYLFFQTKDGQWHDYTDLGRFKSEDVAALKIADDGRGYDYRSLGYIYSTKSDQEDAAGRFGEGIKMLSVAGMRKGLGVHFKSRNWYADATLSQVEIDQKKVDALSYRVKNGLRGENAFDGHKGRRYEVSATVFTEVTPELVEEFRQLPKKVLAIENRRSIDTAGDVQLLGMTGGMLYVRGIMIPGEHQLHFSYNLPKFKIKSRDREMVSSADVKKELARYWSATEESEPIRQFLTQSNIAAQKNKLTEEFKMYFEPKNLDQWKKIFVEVFGDNVSIRPMSSEDFNAFHQNMHVGLEMITVPDEVYNSLKNMGLPTYEKTIGEITNVENIPEEELTPEERSIIQTLYALDEFLPGNRPHQIIAYVGKTPEQRIARGFANGISIYISRRELSSLADAADVYIHEMTHHNTQGAMDAEPGFRNYLTLALSQLALKQIMNSKSEN